MKTRKYFDYFDTDNENSHITLGRAIIDLLNKDMPENATPTLVCIGTDRATGDCLGPLVGEQLFDCFDDIKIFGCLSHPVHALNLDNVKREIYSTIDNPYIIAIDASLGHKSLVGKISLSNSPLFPGKGVNKKMPAIGDISITGVVNISGRNPSHLQSTRLYTVMTLANCISKSLKYSFCYLGDFCPL